MNPSEGRETGSEEMLFLFTARFYAASAPETGPDGFAVWFVGTAAAQFAFANYTGLRAAEAAAHLPAFADLAGAVGCEEGAPPSVYSRSRISPERYAARRARSSVSCWWMLAPVSESPTD